MGKKLLILIIFIAIVVAGYFYYASFQSDPNYFIDKSRAKFNITDYANDTQLTEYQTYLLSEKDSKSGIIKTAIQIEADYWETYLANKNTVIFISETPNLISIDCDSGEATALKTATNKGKLKLKSIKEMLEANKEELGNYYTNMLGPLENMEKDITQHNDLLYILCPD